MQEYAFTGLYETWVELPSGKVVDAKPGTVMEFDVEAEGWEEGPGPLWSDDADHIAAAKALAEAEAKSAEAEPLATGGMVQGNLVTLVGETGPEILDLPDGTEVDPPTGDQTPADPPTPEA